MKHEWTVICTPLASPPSSRKHKGGLVVEIFNGEVRHPVAQVGYARRNTKNPDVPFDEALQAEIKKAEAAVEALNEHEDNLARIKVEADERAEERRRQSEERDREQDEEERTARAAETDAIRERIREVMGTPSGMV